MKLGVPDRLRSGDLLHERQACCLDYTTGTEMERVNGIAPWSRPWHGRILLLNHTRKNGVPSRTLTDKATDIGVGHVSAKVVTDHVRPVQIQCLRKAMDLSRQVGSVVAAGRRCRTADSGEVRGNDRELLREPRNDRTKLGPVLRKS